MVIMEHDHQNLSKTTENQLKNIAPEKIINHHGFSSAPTILQILPILYTNAMLIEFIFLLLQLQNIKVAIPLALIYLVAFIICTVLWYMTSKIDPTDSIQIRHRKALQNSEQLNPNQFKYFCHLCSTYVSKNAFHCKKCNRCVQMFDHHCKWLNNCIGARNYFQFFYLICSTQFILLYHMITNAILISWLSNSDESIKTNWIFFASLVIICLDFLVLCLNSVLFVMHIYLITQKKSTIDLILEMRGANKIHPFEHKREDSFVRKTQQSRDNSGQEWKLEERKTKQKEKIQELVIPPLRQKRSGHEQSQKIKYSEINLLKENERKPAGKLTPIKLVKVPFEQK